MKAIVHAKEIWTGRGIAEKSGRRIQLEDLGIIDDGAVVFDAKKIHWVGPTAELPKKYRSATKKNFKNQRSLLPGFIDCHTHLIFAGNRAQEFALRCGGTSYEEIASRGGGIQTTVRATREATSQELLKSALVRAREAYRFGVRTLEVKSGYGLTLESEIKILEVVKKLKKHLPQMTFHATFLGAHDFPKEKPRAEYLKELRSEMLPLVAKKKLADSCDVFIDEGYYTREEGRAILTAAKGLGLSVRVHADELKNTESASLAAELSALSADHLLQISEAGIAAISKSETVAVLLPTTAFYLKKPHAPARRLIEAGARVALATDFNPGTSMTLNLPLAMTLGALYLGMKKEEIFAAVTFNAAAALGLSHRKGAILPGYDSDFMESPWGSFEEIYYRFGWAPT